MKTKYPDLFEEWRLLIHHPTSQSFATEIDKLCQRTLLALSHAEIRVCEVESQMEQQARDFWGEDGFYEPEDN